MDKVKGNRIGADSNKYLIALWKGLQDGRELIMEISKELHDRLELLNAKYQAIGQDLISYLDGLLYADVTTYWDYIELDTLLSLQKPKTKFPDELVFIVYHQITEL